jgi:hypothetical protein
LNVTTYDHSIFDDIGVTYPISFQRPCVNVCNDANRDCLGLLNVFGTKMDCLERRYYSQIGYGKSIGNTSYSYPFPFTYDQSNDTIHCNSISAVIPVASTIEPYIFAQTGGVCAGISTSLYVPPGFEVSSALAPMQRPHVVQSAIEAKLLLGIMMLFLSIYMNIYI